MDQNVFNRAVRFATNRAMAGNPVERIIWIPPRTASEDLNGIFIVKYAESRGGSDGFPWND